MKTTLTLSAVSVADEDRRNLPSRIPRRTVAPAGHKTSISPENQFWEGLNEIAASEGVTACALIERIDTKRTVHNLSSAIRLYVLDYFQRHRT